MAKIRFAEKQGQQKDYPYPGPFSVAGEVYSSRKELCAEELRKHGCCSICRDIYGREVFVELQEFPQRYSFDDMDWLANERYYRHFYILKDDRLSHVVYEDKQKSIRVIEAESSLYTTTLEKMRMLGWLEDKA